MNKTNLLTAIKAMRNETVNTVPCDYPLLRSLDTCKDLLNDVAPLTTIEQIVLLVQELGISELEGLCEVLATRRYRMKEKEAKKFEALKNVAQWTN